MFSSDEAREAEDAGVRLRMGVKVTNQGCGCGCGWGCGSCRLSVGRHGIHVWWCSRVGSMECQRASGWCTVSVKRA